MQNALTQKLSTDALGIILEKLGSLEARFKGQAGLGHLNRLIRSTGKDTRELIDHNGISVKGGNEPNLFRATFMERVLETRKRVMKEMARRKAT